MTYRKHLVTVLKAAAVLGLGGLSCTDAGLYQWRHDPYQANKLTLSGTVCTDDPRQRDFPVKVLFVVDSSASLMAQANDNAGWRGRAIDDVVGLWSKSPNYHFGVITYAAQARNLIEEGFTRDSSALGAAAASIQAVGGGSTPGGCVAGRCRDLQAAMDLASSVITGDVLAADPGQVARTTYVVVLFTGGPPVPAVGRCACRDKDSEDYTEREGQQVEMWAACPWAECEGCKVTCPENSRCEGSTCFPECDPSCGGNEYCDTDFTCKEGDPSGTPTVPPLSSVPTSYPDTFTQWIPPATVDFPLPSGAQTCDLSCVYNNGQGHADSCEEKVLVGAVRDLKSFVMENGAAQFQLHTTYLPDQVERDATTNDPFAPPCGQEADRARTVRLLNEMAFAGDGDFQLFGDATAITFRDLDLHTSRDPLIFKELVVSNINVVPQAGGITVDTDADGLTDDKEALIGTCPSDEDTDGDGLTDLVEVKLAFDPLVANDPVECLDLESTVETGDDPCAAQGVLEKSWKHYGDADGDQINACEERLLGLQDTLFDSDADGLPDRIELRTGTNYLAMDQLQDMDLDGIVNREEIRGHTDARSNDAQAQLDMAYRYEEVDEGIKDIQSFTQPPTFTGISIRNVSANSQNGIGWLQFKPGPPPTLSWRGPADMGPGGDFGPEVDISVPNQDGYVLSSCRRDTSGACTPDSQDRFITVMVEGEGNYLPQEGVDTIVISSAQRNCIRFRVRNITLMETGMHRLHKTRGNNTVEVYFAESPKNSKDGYGIFRIRSLRLNYLKGPPEERTPPGAEITLSDDDFTIFE